MNRFFIKVGVFRKQSAFSRRHKAPINSKIMYPFCKTKQENKNASSQNIYLPLRPLQKDLTTLFVLKEYEEKKTPPKPPKTWYYFGMPLVFLGHSSLTSWTLYNSLGLLFSFLAACFLRLNTKIPYERTVLSFSCNKDMSKYLIKVVSGEESKNIRKQRPDLIKEVEYGEFYQQTIKTLEEKKIEFNALALPSLTTTIELDAQKTKFYFSNNYQRLETKKGKEDQIKDLSNMEKDQRNNLIIETEFESQMGNSVIFAMKLTQNAQLKYEDYLIALGQGKKISLL